MHRLLLTLPLFAALDRAECDRHAAAGCVGEAFYRGVASAQQPDMVHLALTGRSGEVSIDFASHRDNCSGYGVQVRAGTSS